METVYKVLAIDGGKQPSTISYVMMIDCTLGNDARLTEIGGAALRSVHEQEL